MRAGRAARCRRIAHRPDIELLEGYAYADGLVIEDTLGGEYREIVEALTGADNVFTPERAARALLATFDSDR